MLDNLLDKITWEHLKEPYQHPEIINSVIVANILGEYTYENLCLPYRVELTHEGNIKFISERRASYKKAFLFKPFAFTEDWVAVKRWHKTSLDKIVKESELKPLDNKLDTKTPYFLISRNGRIWATEEGVKLSEEYEGHAFFTFVEICGELYFDRKENDWDLYWQSE